MNITNIFPHLKKKADTTGDVVLGKRLSMISNGGIPNTRDWHTKMGTTPCDVPDRPIDGRWLFHPEELKDGKT